MERIKSFSKYILKSELVRSASVLAFGTVIAQAIPILLQPFLRRYFTPEEFGIYSVYISVIGILMVISSLRYDQTIVLPKSDTDSSTLVSFSILISFSFSALLLIIAIIFKDKIVYLLNINEGQGYIVYLIPLGTFLLSAFQSFNFWLVRKKSFFAISGNKLARRLVEGSFQSVFAIKGFSKGLVYGDVLGQFANVFTSYYQSIKKGFSIKDFSWNRALILARKYSEFPKFNLVPSAMSAASFLLPVILINQFFSAEQAGYFDLSKLMLSIPLALIASSFSSVILQKTSENFRQKHSIIKDLLPILFVTAFIAIIEVLFIVFFGSGFFALIFGDTWRYSGEISKVLVWSFALNFMASSFTSIFVALNRIKFQSLWQIIYFTSILSLIFFKKIEFINFLEIYVVIEIFCILLLFGLLVFIVAKYENSLKSK